MSGPLLTRIQTLSQNEPIKLIHIGKCGGSSVREYLNRNRIAFSPAHLNKPETPHNKKYLICIRNPVERFISAYHWRRSLVSYGFKKQKNRFKGESDFFKKCPTINHLINLEFQPLSEFYVHHMREDINFYLEDLLKHIDCDQILGTISPHFLYEDVEEVLGIDTKNNKIHKKDNRKFYNKLTLKEKDRDSIKKYLIKDYMCIEKLNTLKEIKKKKLNVLLA